MFLLKFEFFRQSQIDANNVIFHSNLSFWEPKVARERVSNLHAFMIHGVAFSGARKTRGVQVDPLVTPTT